MYSIYDDQVLSENICSLPQPIQVSQTGYSRWPLPLYLGGFLGPFGTMMVISIYPELRESFNASTQAVNWAFSGYDSVKHAHSPCREPSVTIWSTTSDSRHLHHLRAGIGTVRVRPDTHGVRRRSPLQGAANAFITPLLIAGLVKSSTHLASAVPLVCTQVFRQSVGQQHHLPVASPLRSIGVSHSPSSQLSASCSQRNLHGEPRPAAAPPRSPLINLE